MNVQVKANLKTKMFSDLTQLNVRDVTKMHSCKKGNLFVISCDDRCECALSRSNFFFISLHFW